MEKDKERIEKIKNSINHSYSPNISDVSIYNPPIICDICGCYCSRRDATILRIKGKERYVCNNIKFIKRLLKEELMSLI
jgi:alpha-D-ribose 1-methylphosphonate 5-phosphate C-P lyase